MFRKNQAKRFRKRKRVGQFASIAACPLCRASYGKAGAKVLDERSGKHLVHIECVKCGNSVLAVILSSASGISSVGMVTDLTADDALRFKDFLGVSTDDVICLHEMLKINTAFITSLKNVT